MTVGLAFLVYAMVCKMVFSVVINSIKSSRNLNQTLIEL